MESQHRLRKNQYSSPLLVCVRIFCLSHAYRISNLSRNKECFIFLYKNVILLHYMAIHQIFLILLTVIEYSYLAIANIPCYLPVVGIEPAISRWFHLEALLNQTPISIAPCVQWEWSYNNEEVDNSPITLIKKTSYLVGIWIFYKLMYQCCKKWFSPLSQTDLNGTLSLG